MCIDPSGKDYSTYKDYNNSSDLDSDLIVLYLWKGVREPQNEEEKKWKDELDEMKKRGEVPAILWFE